MNETEPLLRLVGVGKQYSARGGRWFDPQSVVRAVDGVSFDIRAGETLGLVGESGSGKSTIGQMIVHLTTPTSGQILFEGRDIAALDGKQSFGFTRAVQIIFQDPYSSLNPQRSVGATLARVLKIHGMAADRRSLRSQILALISEVGLREPERFIDRYPHEMSGGERQRVAIARAIALRPKLIVADEAVSSLDVSVRAQILELLRQLQEKHGLAYLFITHDLATLRHVSQRVAVIHRGKIVEIGAVEEVIERPNHPYTQALLSAIPIPDPTLCRSRRSKPTGPPAIGFPILKRFSDT